VVQEQQTTMTYLEGKCSLVQDAADAEAIGACLLSVIYTCQRVYGTLDYRNTLDRLERTKSLTSEDEIDNRDKVADAGRHASHNEPAPLDVRHSTAVARQSYVVSDEKCPGWMMEKALLLETCSASLVRPF